jgi:hypothetical protein
LQEHHRVDQSLPESHPPEPVLWLTKWDASSDIEVRRIYVEDELARIIAEGWPPLYAVMTLPLYEQRDMALEALGRVSSTVTLKLSPFALPPPSDPYGRPIHPSKAGMLIAKVGTRGGGKDAQGTTAAMWSGSGRMAANRPNSRQPLYDIVEIGSQPVTLSLTRAAAVMAQWGYGVRSGRWRGKNPQSRRDTWLVIEAGAGEILLPPIPKQEPSRDQSKGRAA